LAADRLMESPKLYSTFLLWLLSELFQVMPEVGDVEKPKFVFFFDEAHLLFDDAPKALLDKIEQVVRLIRSKGIGVYFVSQSPLDVPETVLGQLSKRVQHAVPAIPPADEPAKPKPEPRLREAQPVPSSPVPKTTARHSDSITTTIVKSAARTATNIAVREASKAIFGSGRNAGILGGLVRGVLGG